MEARILGHEEAEPCVAATTRTLWILDAVLTVGSGHPQHAQFTTVC